MTQDITSGIIKLMNRNYQGLQTTEHNVQRTETYGKKQHPLTKTNTSQLVRKMKFRLHTTECRTEYVYQDMTRYQNRYKKKNREYSVAYISFTINFVQK